MRSAILPQNIDAGIALTAISPVKNPDAELYSELDYSDVLDKELKVMDLAAFTLARDHNLPIRVFNMNKPGALRRVIMGEQEGTLIHHKNK